MRKLIWVPLIIVVALVLGRLFYYGLGSSYTPPPAPILPTADLTAVARASHGEVVDNPTVGKGTVAIDYAHGNALYIEELNVLLSKLVNRGFKYEIIPAPPEPVPPDGSGSNDLTLVTVPPGDITGNTTPTDTDKGLAEKLRYAEALILPLPWTEYTPQEIADIKSFVEKGGRVLIIGDPTRTVTVEAINSIAGVFGIIYANDYLYSLQHNDNNYRNVVYSNFKESPVTQGLDKEHKVVLYAAGSVNAPGQEIIQGDDTTFSSVSEGGRKMAAAALTTNDQVLALGDLTFLGEPYSAAESNGQLINNLADFLTGGKRNFELVDFPFFLNPQIDLAFDDSLVLNSQFDNSVKLKEFLETADYTATFTNKIGHDHDVIFVSRFDKAEPVKEYLAQGGITILDLDQKSKTNQGTPEATPTEVTPKSTPVSEATPGPEDRFVTGRIHIEGVGELERGGSTLFYRHKEGNRNILIILSDTAKTNADAFDLLFTNKLGQCRLSENIAVCQTQEPDGGLPPSLRRSRIDKILVVSGDSGRSPDNLPTGMFEFTEAISKSYKFDNWVISEQGSPDVDQLLGYDAVIWATGDYWLDSISEGDAALLSKYVEIGGNLILSGASLSFDWRHSDFITKVLHAHYLDSAWQSDLKVLLPDHPIATGFAQDETISFTQSLSGTETTLDVISHTPNARVVFGRGLQSQQSGAASVIAYEDDRVKIAYFAFPIYLLPAESRNKLIDNTINWFSRKPLPLPDETEFKPFEPTTEPALLTPTEEPVPLTPTEEPTPNGEENQPGNGGDQNQP